MQIEQFSPSPPDPVLFPSLKHSRGFLAFRIKTEILNMFSGPYKIGPLPMYLDFSVPYSSQDLLSLVSFRALFYY